MDITPGKQFLLDFFKANGENPNWEKAFEHFNLAFVEPSRFDKLVADLTPVEGQLKVVVVDGHPRSGKSWAVVKALEIIVDDLALSPGELWTSGLDSLGVLPNDNDSLHAGACRVERQLQQHPAYKLVLLDDFLGTNQLRPFGVTVYDQRLKPFLLWDKEKNPWLRNMSNGSVLVLTGRSLHFMLVDILLSLNTRQEIFDINGLTVINSRRGLFRTLDKGEPFGSFNKDTLREVCKKNRQYHPMKDADPDWLVIATPLLAFEDCVDPSYSDRERLRDSLTKGQKELAASSLFGEDIDSIAEMLITMETISDNQSLSWLKEVLSQLYKAYLVTIAPGLLFLAQTAYKQLGLDDEIKDIVVRGLYLNETIDEFGSGRLPNEFYMIALNDHFTKYLDLAAKAFARVVNPTDGEIKDAENIPGLGIRGFLERGLHTKDNAASKSLMSVREFKYVVDTYLKYKNDCLLHLEVGDYPSNKTCSVQMSPGLAAAIGWSLENFFDPLTDKVRHTVTEWFPIRFKFLLEELSNTFRIWQTDPSMPDDVRDPNILPDYYSSKWKVTATYSAFLQWVIRMEIDPEKKELANMNVAPEKRGLLDEIINLTKEIPNALYRELKIIIEDELIWAFGECDHLPETLFPIETYLPFLTEAGATSNISTSDQSAADNCLKVNRLFSLAWHNKWMENPNSLFGKDATRWIEVNKESALSLLKKEPELIDDNLQYHWFHFITQRAVWMRDWCFQDNPDQFERNYSQITEGSSEANHNELLMTIAKIIFSNKAINKERIRNLLMLLGTRVTRLLSFEVITKEIDEMTVPGNQFNQEVRQSVLQGIFELARQGFLEEPSYNMTKYFHSWCRNKVETFQSDMESAWKPYWDGLSSMTHLDLLPRQTNGWEDVMPRNWQRGKLLGG